jgi:CheY-like chemotaxis protein
MTERQRKFRILVIEDDDRLVFAISEAVADAGYEAMTAGDGHAAVQRLSLFKPDVIILDLDMPFVDGFTFLEWLKKAGFRIPVILSTADDDHSAEELGAVVKLSKPFTQEQLLDALTAALGAGAEH